MLSLFRRKVNDVGHIVSEDVIEPDPEKIEKVTSWPRPENSDDIRKVLGFVGYYRRFIQNVSRIARHLSILMPPPLKKRRNAKKKDDYPHPWQWGEEQEEAFQTLKTCLSGPPTVSYPDFSKPFVLHTDVSGLGLGAVLYQHQTGVKRVIAYASRGLTKAERRYPAHSL